ncbi:hypothetical protein JCM3765_006597 [Sporobolomyces pararoseus]
MAIHFNEPLKIPTITKTTDLSSSSSEEHDSDSSRLFSSSLRTALLSTSRQLDTSSSTTSENSIIVPSNFLKSSRKRRRKGEAEIEEEKEEELNELVWKGSLLEWIVTTTTITTRSSTNKSSSSSSGISVLKKRWDYTELGEKIKFVRIVQFQSSTQDYSLDDDDKDYFEQVEEEEEEENEEGKQQRGERENSSSSSKRDQDLLWGPYRTLNEKKKGGTKSSEWSDEVLKLPTQPPFPSSSSFSSPPRLLRPHILIVLSTLAFLHPISRISSSSSSTKSSNEEGGNLSGGGGIPIHLPFKLSSIYPLESGGVLFERDREGKEVTNLLFPQNEEDEDEEERDSNNNTVPVWWSMSSKTGGYGELKPVLINNLITTEGAECEEEEGKVLKDLNEKLIFVSNEFGNSFDKEMEGDSTKLKIGVSVNEKKGKVIVWRYDKIVGSSKVDDNFEGELEKNSSWKGKGKGKERDLDSVNMSLSPTNSTTTSSKSRRTRRQTKSAELDFSNLSNSNRSLPSLGSIMRGGGGGGGVGTGTGNTSSSRRRSARLSRSYTPHDNSSNDLLLSAALDSSSHSHSLTPHDISSHHLTRPSIRRTHTLQTDAAGGGGGGTGNGRVNSPENRRTSLTRNDLSVTMDRMALSQGSSVGGAGGGGAPTSSLLHTGMLFSGGIETLMDREATVYLGEEEWVDQIGKRNWEGEERSEWKFTKIWEGDLDGTSAKGIQVDLFDQRSPTTATLSILLPAASTLLLLSLSLDTITDELSCTPIKQIEANDACTVVATRSEIKDLLLKKPSGEFGLISCQGMELEVAGLDRSDEDYKIDSNGGKGVVLSSGKIRQLTSVKIGIENRGLGSKVLETLAQVLGTQEFGEVLRNVFRRAECENGFERVRGSLEEMFGIDSETSTNTRGGLEDSSFLNRLRTSSTLKPPISSSRSNVDFTSTHFAILLSLHLLVQSLRLRISTTQQARILAKFVVRLASSVGARGWVDDYRRTWGPEVAGFAADLALPSGFLPKIPPNILSHLYNLLSCSTLPDSTPFSLSSVAQLFTPDSPSFYYGTSSSPLSSLSSVLEIYSLLSPSASSTPTQRAHQAIYRFHELGFTTETLQDLPFGISVPIREAMRTCQLDPPEPGMTRNNEGRGGEKKWDGFWNLIGRRELERFPMRIEEENRKRTNEAHSPVDIDALVQQVESSLSKGNQRKIVSIEMETDKPNLNPTPRAARFNEDKRMEEVSRMLQYVEPVVIAPGEKTLDQLTPQVQQSILSALSHRTFSLPVGAAMFQLASIRQSSSDSLAIPKLNTSARIVPMSSPVALAEKERDPAVSTIPERSEWPDFHCGVNAALRLDLERGKPVDSSQISFNRPAELDARHAGLLLGLGLNGQLGSMLSSQAYDYLKAKHDPTSVAILLGLAVTFLGTSDPTVTSVISIHLPALHPPRSSSLNVSGMTKSAAAVALGYLHFATGRRSLADVLVREMCGVKIINVEDASACREAYALSCGFAFGFIMLGQGEKAGSSTSSNEVDLLRVFRALILGENNRPLPGAFYPSQSSNAPIDVNITSSAATIGLALMFIRSERQDVANVFEIPDSPRRLDYVRSDVLLLRSLSRGLVMWNSVTPSKEWIESGLPPFLAVVDPSKPMDSDLEVARWSVIAGACFAVGFKFAGTATAEAHATLIHYMDRLTRACYVKASTVQSKIKRHSLRTCLGVVSIALSMVMAGTGELNVLRRLRVAHGHFSEGLTYGYHLSTHMALGLLFLGEAKYTLSNTNGAIASLLLALFPVFPSSSTDNRAHLQAYRHLWVLAAEPRYLEARDIDSNEPVFLPVRLRLVDQNQSQGTKEKVEVKAKQLVAPTLIPDVRLLDSIQVESPRYWGFTVRLNSNPDQFSRFLRNSTLYVKRRTGHLSYAQDPRGIRSIFTRSKSETGSAVYDFGETTKMLNPSASGLRDFVAAFSDDAEAIAATEQLCLPADSDRPPSEFEAFCASVLLECLTKDKRDISSVYHSMYQANSLLSPSLVPSTDTLFAAEQLRLVVDFYKRGIFKTLFGKSSSKSKSSSSSSSSSSREPLLNPAFIDHVSATLTSRIDAISASSSTPSNPLSTYLTFPGTWPSTAASTIPLALQLSQHSVPDLSGLEQLHLLVRGAKRDGMEPKDLELLVRCTAGTIESSGKKAWSTEVSQIISSD